MMKDLNDYYYLDLQRLLDMLSKNPKETKAFVQNAGRMAQAEVKIGKAFLRNHGFNL